MLAYLSMLFIPTSLQARARINSMIKYATIVENDASDLKLIDLMALGILNTMVPIL